jgi:DNA-binding MarR family transcriptional regulator
MKPRKPHAPAYVDPKGEFPFDVPTYLFHLFVVVARYRDARLDKALRPLGLNVSRHRAVSVIARMAPCTMSQLSDFSAVDRTTMTRTVDQLFANGLVERTTPASDRRQVLLTVTAAGRAVHQRALRAVYRVNRRTLEGIPEDDQRSLVRTKQVMLANLVADADLAKRLLSLRRDDED